MTIPRDERTVTGVAFILTPGSVHVGWAGIGCSVPAFASATGEGWLYGAAAPDVPERVDVTALLDAATVGTEAELGAVLNGLVAYAAASTGAPDAGVACAVHPTWWNERRRDLLRTAVRQVAGDGILLPVAVAAARVADISPHERCAVLEFAGRGIAAVSVVPSGVDGPAVERVARDPDLSVHSADAAVRLERLLISVSGGSGPDVVVVTGGPGEPSGVDLLALVADLVGVGRRIVPAAASEMLAAMTGTPTAPAGTEPAPSVSPAAGPAIVGSDGALPWLTEVRTRSDSARAARDGRARILFAVAAMIPAVLAGAVFLWPLAAGGRGESESPGPADIVAAEEVPTTATPNSDPGPVSSQQFDIGPVRLELPDSWRLRDPATVHSGRTELIPAGGADRRILLVYRDLAEGVDEESVASALAVRAAERAPVIRDLDTDTTFADRKVVAYTEVPEDYSVVRWSVLVFPGFQVSVGCQYLDGEWRRIRNECEQAVHTLRID